MIKTLLFVLSLMKVTKDYDLKRIISFHARVKNAESFANYHSALYECVSKKNKPEGIF